jgi:multiple sugar transport system permease protein
MPHIAVVGRRGLKTRAMISTIYLVLALGAVTMVVPFWLLISMSFTSNVDSQEFRLIPAYFFSDEALYKKYEESAFNEDPQLYGIVMGDDIGDFREVKAPAKISEAAIKDYTDFKAKLPLDYTLTSHAYSVSKPKLSLAGAQEYQAFLTKRFHNDIEELNKAYMDTQVTFLDLQIPREQWYLRVYQPLRDQRFKDLMEFKASLPPRFTMPAPADGAYRDWLKFKAGDNKPETFSKRWGVKIERFTDIRLHERIPQNPKEAADWVDYVRNECPYHFIRVDAAALPEWRAYIRNRYNNDIASLHKLYTSKDPSRKDPWETLHGFDAVELPAETPREGQATGDWGQFIEKQVSIQYVSLDTPETRYYKYLHSLYTDIARLNTAYGTTYASFDDVQFPIREAEWSYMMADKGAIKKDFVARNYRDVINYISLHGRAMYNTLVLVICTVLLTLTVNPLAAYALSRYNLPSTYKILLFCLATMAFPAEVTVIPTFLLMKNLHMLNTFWALILPGAANGFAIFLLKGFFDGLPQELYEAAELDGASEIQLFTRVCLPMSTPVLAVIGLGAFTGAYGSFLWAFVVCPNKIMWTLMVWLQQMGAWAPQSMIFAALVLMAIPTLLVFIFAQDIIMRGVIIPMEK